MVCRVPPRRGSHTGLPLQLPNTSLQEKYFFSVISLDSRESPGVEVPLTSGDALKRGSVPAQESWI